MEKYIDGIFVENTRSCLDFIKPSRFTLYIIHLELRNVDLQ